MNIFLKIILCLCAVFLFLFPYIKPKVKKWRKILYFLAVIAIIISIFIPSTEKQLEITTKLSDEDIEKVVNQVSDVIRQHLDKTYPSGNYQYGTYENKIYPPSNPSTDNVKVIWQSGYINYSTLKEIKLRLPDIEINTMRIIGTEITLPKKIGFKACPIKLSNYKICVEIKAIIRNITIVGVGIIRE